MRPNSAHSSGPRRPINGVAQGGEDFRAAADKPIKHRRLVRGADHPAIVSAANGERLKGITGTLVDIGVASRGGSAKAVGTAMWLSQLVWPVRIPNTRSSQEPIPDTQANVLLVGQTVEPAQPLLGCVPTRPSQNSPERVTMWERRRRAVGQRIRALRIERTLTQEALALRSGVTRNVLIDVEHGRRSLLYERLFDLADALGVPVAELLPEDE
jgi:DNA-binding XRE family transcriptional regulator